MSASGGLCAVVCRKLNQGEQKMADEKKDEKSSPTFLERMRQLGLEVIIDEELQNSGGVAFIGGGMP
jgi:hypothetical protein